jgi:hypothetical protein
VEYFAVDQFDEVNWKELVEGDLPPSKWSGLNERIWCILTLEKEA